MSDCRAVVFRRCLEAKRPKSKQLRVLLDQGRSKQEGISARSNSNIMRGPTLDLWRQSITG